MDDVENGLTALLEAIESTTKAAIRESVLENMSNIIGILMMRQGVEKLELSGDELAALTLKYDGRGLEIEPKGDIMHVTLGADSKDKSAPDTHYIN